MTLDERMSAIAQRLDGEAAHRFAVEITEAFGGIPLEALAEQAAAGDDAAVDKLRALAERLSGVVRAWEVSILLVADPAWHRAMAEPVDPNDRATFDELAAELRQVALAR